MKATFSLRGLLLGLALVAPAALPARAQPDVNNAPKAANPQNRPARPDRAKMTPEERQARQAQRQAQNFKRQLERFGVTDAARQSAVTNYIQSETEARAQLQQSGRALSTALRTDAVTDTQVAALLNTYNANIEDDKIRRAAAQKKLNEQIDLLKFPRLEALLTVMGVYGDGTGFGGAMPANRGARGAN